MAECKQAKKPAAKKAAPKKPAAKKPAAKRGPKAAAKAAKADSEDEVSDAQISDNDESLSQTPPKAKKAPGAKRAGSKPLADVENESFGGDAADDSKSGNAADKYQKVSPSLVAKNRLFRH